MCKATRLEPGIRHVVITSSFAAIRDAKDGGGIGKTYTADDWNPATYEQAKESDTPPFIYSSSKKLAEAAAWDYQKEQKPSWALTTICPRKPLCLAAQVLGRNVAKTCSTAMIYGPPSQVVTSLDSLNTSTARTPPISIRPNRASADAKGPLRDLALR